MPTNIAACVIALTATLLVPNRGTAQQDTTTRTTARTGPAFDTTKRAEKKTTSSPTAPSPGENAPKPAAQLPSLDSVRVLSVRRLDDTATKRATNQPTRAGLGDLVVVRVSHLQSLVNYASCLSLDERPVPSCQERDIALYLDGREIRGLKPESGAPQPAVEELQFHLARTPDSDEAWADLLGNPPLTEDRFFTRPTALSVGLAGVSALPSNVGTTVTRFELVRLRKVWFVISSIVLVLLLGLVCFWAASSTLLRDPGPVTAVNGKDTYPPYSLGRVQMAFWFVLVLLSFVYIWLVTGGWDTVTGSVLALIGIGTGTALGAAVIDGNKPDPKAAARRSTHFLDDILSDASGVSFHRFQMFAWTLVLGVMFVYSVWRRLAMPEFSGTLLALLGISGGTYLGFKIPEKQS